MIRGASFDDLQDVVDVHSVCFPKSFSTTLGKARGGYLLKKFYKEYLDQVQELFLVAVNDRNDIVGFAMGYYCERNDYQKNFLKHNFMAIFVRVFCLLCNFNEVTWKKLLSVFIKEKALEITDDKYVSISNAEKGDLLSICVAPEYRGRGLSVELIEAFESVLRRQGRKYVQLTVERDNPRAIKFYQKMGYQTYKTLGWKNQGMYKAL